MKINPQEYAKIGFEFEIYSKLGLKETATSLEKWLNKTIIIPLQLVGLNILQPQYHSQFQPTDEIWKLEPDYSGGQSMMEIITGPLEYKQAVEVLHKMCEWITENGYTNERCSIHVNLSLDTRKIQNITSFKDMNVLKFILSFDEEMVFKYFPERKQSVYAKPIKNIILNSPFFKQGYLNSDFFSVPHEKYYGVNFTKLEKSYLEYRYMGGEDWHRQTDAILKCIDMFIEHQYSVLKYPQLGPVENTKLQEITQKYKYASDAFIKYSTFKKLYPDVVITVDLDSTDVLLELYWDKMRDVIFHTIFTNPNFKTGHINYDTDLSVIQLKDCKIQNITMTGIEFIQCEVDGIFYDCSFYECSIKNSRITGCKLMMENTVNFSKVQNCFLPQNNILIDCYIELKTGVLNCEVKKGVIRKANIGPTALIHKDVLMVQPKVEKPAPQINPPKPENKNNIRQ